MKDGNEGVRLVAVSGQHPYAMQSCSSLRLILPLVNDVKPGFVC